MSKELKRLEEQRIEEQKQQDAYIQRPETFQAKQLAAYKLKPKGPDPKYTPLTHFPHPTRCDEHFHQPSAHSVEIRPCESTLHKTHHVCLLCIHLSASNSPGIIGKGCLARLCTGCTDRLRPQAPPLSSQAASQSQEERSEEEEKPKEKNTCHCPFSWETPQNMSNKTIYTPFQTLPGNQKWHCHECRATYLWRAETSVANFADAVKRALGNEYRNDNDDNAWETVMGSLCPGCLVPILHWQPREDEWEGSPLNVDFDLIPGGWTLSSLRCFEQECERHIAPFFDDGEGVRRHVRDDHGFCPDSKSFASMCVACEGVVWHPTSNGYTSGDLNYKFKGAIDECPRSRFPNRTGQVLGHRILPNVRNIAPNDQTPQNPANDISALILDTTASTSLPSLPLEWQGQTLRQPNPTNVYPPLLASPGGGTETPFRENITLDELKEIQALRDFMLWEARRNSVKMCWNCGKAEHLDTECTKAISGRHLDKEIDDKEKKRDEDMGKP